MLQQIGETVPAHCSPENFIALNVADLIQHPNFDAHLRDAILMLTERGGEATVAELAEVVGIDAATLISRVVGETVLFEFKRLAVENRGAH